MTSFYTTEELPLIGFKSYGENVLISRKCSIYNPKALSIGSNVRIDDFCILSGNINIGSNIHIAPFCCLFGNKGIVLNDFSGLSSRVTIYSESDDYIGEGLTSPVIPDKYRVIKGSLVEIGRHALVGSGAIILPGGNLKEGSVLGAMSLLKTTTDSWYIYAGVPAVKLKIRKRDVIINFEKEFLDATNS